VGYNPAGNLTTTGSLGHLATVWYNRTALDQLKQMNRFFNLGEMDMLPKRNGKTVQWYRYSLFGANTTPHAEGTVGTSLTLGSSTVSGTMQEYADFASVSSFLMDTAIDPIVDNAAENLGYRASISVDTITRNEFDANTSVLDSLQGATFTATDVRAAVARLKSINVRPKANGDFLGVIHPYVTFDLQADNTAGGFIDQGEIRRSANDGLR
jgi:N4-gp56 family major capsid protein